MKYVLIGHRSNEPKYKFICNVNTNKKDALECQTNYKHAGIEIEIIPEKTFFNSCSTFEEKLDLFFRYFDSPCEYVVYTSLKSLVVDVSWGDWKHTHQALDYYMTKLFDLSVSREIVTDENGCDTYSSRHFYNVPKHLLTGENNEKNKKQ